MDLAQTRHAAVLLATQVGGWIVIDPLAGIAKDLIDRMHSWYTEDDAGFPLHPLAREIGGIRFYDSLVVIEKLPGSPSVAWASVYSKVPSPPAARLSTVSGMAP